MALGLAALVIGVYGITLSYGFVYEDWNLQPRWWALKWEAPWNFRLVPRGLTIGLQLWLLRQVGPVPAWFHAMSLGLHTMNVLLLFIVARNFSAKLSGAFLPAALFAIHPVQLESVAYSAALAELTSTAMVLFGLWALERRFFVVALLSCGLAVWAKETAIVAVALLPLWSWYRRQSWPYPLIVLYAASTLYGVYLLAARFVAVPDLRMLATSLAQLSRLLLLIPVPYGLTIDHDWRWITEATSTPILWLWIIAAGGLVLWRQRDMRFLVLWTLLAVGPRLVVPLQEGMHEHHLYLVMVGWCVVFGMWISGAKEGNDLGLGRPAVLGYSGRFLRALKSAV